MVVEILLIFIVYFIIIVLGSYYVNLYLTKEQFSKEELKDVFPYLTQFWNRISTNYSSGTFIIILLVSAIVGILIPMISYHWFLNSSIVFVVLFILFPIGAKYVEGSKVTTTSDFSDTIKNIFVKYNSVILIGFGSGTATALIYNWGALKAIYFLWFLLNIIVVTVLLGISVKNMLNS